MTSNLKQSLHINKFITIQDSPMFMYIIMHFISDCPLLYIFPSKTHCTRDVIITDFSCNELIF